MAFARPRRSRDGVAPNLLAFAYATHGVHPTLLERDFNFPPLPVLLAEVRRIRELQAAAA